ncbi:MAG: hypothetical protein ACRDBO_09615 [Lachnospiraceae bacterium]
MTEKTLAIVMRFLKILLFFIGIAIIYVWHKYLRESFWLLRNENHPVKIVLMYLVMVFICIILPNILISIAKYVLNVKLRQKREHELSELQLQIKDQSKSFNTETLIKLFENAKTEKPKLKELMEEAIRQFEIFYDDKETINVVMSLQEIRYDVIDNGIRLSEEKLLKTMKSILVDVSIWNPKQLEDEARRDSFDEIYCEIKTKLKTNKKNLDYFHKLLMRVRDINADEISEDKDIKLLLDALDKE